MIKFQNLQQYYFQVTSLKKHFHYFIEIKSILISFEINVKTQLIASQKHI